MTQRLQISAESVNWRDGQKVDERDLRVEQTGIQQTTSAILNNFFGSGLLSQTTQRVTIFDSTQLTQDQQMLISANIFDGNGIAPHAQPVDNSLGAQLEVTLSDSIAKGNKSTKVLVIGLDFQNNLQYETFVFHLNESQVGKKHFTRVLGLLFNDFKGNDNGSRNLGGQITIKEALPMQVSRSCLMSAQNVEPNLFFRDLKLYSLTDFPNVTVALSTILQNVIGSGYSVNALDIKVTGLNKRNLIADDITTHYGQKFQATTNNIQKITLLLGADNVGGSYDWSGTLVVSIYALQTSVSCPTDIVPETLIDFLPDPTPLAQLTFTQADLEANGYKLNNVEQPVDFIFANTKIGSTVNTGIVAGQYYMIDVRRSGAAGTGSLFMATGGSHSETSRFTFFNGVAWTDVTEEDMWYEVYSDSLKVADGMGVDAGASMFVPKTNTNATTGLTEDYSKEGISFINSGQNQLNFLVAQAVRELYLENQDPRTGTRQKSRQIYKASVSAVSSATLALLKTDSEPVVIGSAYDTNSKNSVTIIGTQDYFGQASGNTFTIINPPISLLSNNLIGCKIVPNIANPTAIYRIVDVKLCTDGYGDVNGDGKIDRDDIAAALALKGEDVSTEATQIKISQGEFTVQQVLRADVDGDGIVSDIDVGLITDYVEHRINSFPAGYSFPELILYLEHNLTRHDGYYDYSDIYARKHPLSTEKIAVALMNDEQKIYYGHPDRVLVESDVTFNTAPFVAVSYRITNTSDYWQEHLVRSTYAGRLLPCAFTYNTSNPDYDCDAAVEFKCEQRYAAPPCDGGRVDMFVPANLVVAGSILSTNGNSFPIDFETNTVTIEFPEEQIISGSIDIFRMFVADKGNGFTIANYPAMKFSDCSLVQGDALENNQVKFSVAIQSYHPNLDGYSILDGYGIIIDPIMTVSMNHETGLLEFNSTNQKTDPVNTTLRTKLQITVMLKKAGWKNIATSVDYLDLPNLVGL